LNGDGILGVVSSGEMQSGGETATAMSTQSGPQSSGAGRVSVRDLCCLFCCPPLPSSIVSKLAFMPPQPSYRIVKHDAQL
uniref:PLAC8 like 1 n=1 Tax=Gongylonema pulchrum TaxID=637853 RepID=A0A183DKX9_9BILA